MKLEIKPRKYFLEKIRNLPKEEIRLIYEKLKLAAENPFRYKTINAPGLTKVFEIKITIQGVYSRIIFLINENHLEPHCIIRRKDDFKDLLKELDKARKEN